MRAKLVLLSGFFLILFFPSQLGFHYWPSWAIINGLKIDYLSPTLLFTDLLAILFIIFSRPKISQHSFYVLLSISIFNYLFSIVKLITLFHWLRLFLYYLIYLSFKKNLNNFKKYWFTALSVSILWSSVLAILQFIKGSSLGVYWYWLGERPLSLAIPYISKTYLPNLGYYLRPYATFPHPNALFGYLLVSLIVIYQYKNVLILNIKYWTLSIGVIALLLTFSKLLFFPLIIVYPQSLTERLTLINNSITILQKYPLSGIGLGTYPVATIELPSTGIQLSYQPVHNIFLLLLVELGLPLFIYILYLVIKYCLKIKNFNFKIIIFALLLSGSVDHYWLTSPSNLLLLTLCASLVSFSKTPDLN